MTKDRIHQLALGIEEELRKFDLEVRTMGVAPTPEEYTEARIWQVERFLQRQFPEAR